METERYIIHGKICFTPVFVYQQQFCGISGLGRGMRSTGCLSSYFFLLLLLLLLLILLLKLTLINAIV